MRNLNKLGLERANKLYSFLGIIFIVVLFLLAYRKLWGSGMLAYGDCAPLPESAATAFKTFFSAWYPRVPGTNLGAPWLLIRGALIFICGGNAPLAQKILHFSPLLLSFLTMFIFLNQLVKSRFAKYIGAFVYSVNPITMGEFLGGGDYSVYVHALFPLLLIFLWRLLYDRKILHLLIFTLLLTFAYLCADYVLIILFPFVLFFLGYSLFMNRKPHLGFKKIILSLFIILLPFVFCFLLLLPYTFFFLKIALPFLSGPRGLLPTNVMMQLMADLRYCYGAWTLDEIIRLGGSLYAPVFGGRVVWTQFGYILPLLAFSSIFFIRDKRKRKFIIGFVILSISTILFIYLTHLRVVLGLFQAFPFLFRFRNPARPILLLVFAYAPLIAITIEGIQRKLGMSFTRLLTNSWRSRPIIISLLLSLMIAVSISIYNWPFFTGDLTLKHNRGSNYEIPSHFYEMGKWLQKRRSSEGFFRTLWLPWIFDETERKLLWVDPYTLSVILGYEQYARSFLTDYVELVFSSIADGNVRHLESLIALGNVRYVIVNLASEQKGAPIASRGYLSGDPQNFVDFFNGQKNLKLIVTDEKYLIYENKKFIPHIATYQNVSFIPSLPRQHNSPLETLATLVDVSGPDVEKQLLIFNAQLSSQQVKLFSDNLGKLRKNSILLPEYSLYDEFNGDSLNELEWVSDGPVNLGGGVLSIPLQTGVMNYLESIHRFSPGVSVEIRTRLNRTDRSCNINLMYDVNNMVKFNFFGYGPNLSVVTYDLGQYTQTNIEKWDSGYHTYKIIWQYDQVRYYIDGTLKAIHKTNVPRKRMRIRFDGEGGQTFNVDYIKAEKLYHDPITTLSTQFDEKAKIRSYKVSETEYRVETESKGALFLVLGEAYHPSWSAYVNGERLEHFPAFYWANGFYLNKAGENQVEIVYEEQKIKNRMMLISGAFWLLFLGSLLVVFTREIIMPYLYKRKRQE